VRGNGEIGRCCESERLVRRFGRRGIRRSRRIWSGARPYAGWARWTPSTDAAAPPTPQRSAGSHLGHPGHHHRGRLSHCAVVDGGALVRQCWLHEGLLDRAEHKARALRRVRSAHGSGRGFQPADRISHPAGLSADLGGTAEPRPLSRAARAAAPLGHGRRTSRAGNLCRIGRRKPVADLPALGQPGALRLQGRAVQARYRLLRLHAAVASLHRRIPHHGPRPGGACRCW